jgi:hypothetical protein
VNAGRYEVCLMLNRVHHQEGIGDILPQGRFPCIQRYRDEYQSYKRPSLRSALDAGEGAALSSGICARMQNLYKLRPVVIRHESWSIPGLAVHISAFAGKEVVVGMLNDGKPRRRFGMF